MHGHDGDISPSIRLVYMRLKGAWRRRQEVIHQDDGILGPSRSDEEVAEDADYLPIWQVPEYRLEEIDARSLWFVLERELAYVFWKLLNLEL
ncbi:hypothetical protein NW754_000804 [Fusarium falciforme]|nr:hypothetical protein NW754_000804 [Fusarium falciforme]